MILPAIWEFFFFDWIKWPRGLKVADKAGCHLGSKSEFWQAMPLELQQDRGRRTNCQTKMFMWVFRFKPAVWWTSINRYHGFHALAKRRFFTCFTSTRRITPAFKPFLQYFRTGWHLFMSRLRGVRICWVFVGGSLNYRLIYALSYNHISFLNTRSQLVWVLGIFLVLHVVLDSVR